MSTNSPAVRALVDALLALGVTPDGVSAALAAAGTEAGAGTGVPVVLTVADYLPRIRAAAKPGSCRTYSTYWEQLAEALGGVPVAAVTVTQLKGVAEAARRRAVRRRNSRDGRSAKENCVAAMRYFFTQAVADKLREDNPALQVAKPTRAPSPRRPLTEAELTELWQVTTSGGNDTALDALLLRFHLETGARRGGAIGLRLTDLDPERQLVRLREKNSTVRWQPVSATLMDALREHAAARGAHQPTEQVLRQQPRAAGAVGAPLTRRRYNTLTDRWQAALPWAAHDGVSPHWLRHTAIAAVERVAGFGVARAFAGHAKGEVTTTYITGSAAEVARAVSALTGEAHPLASTSGGTP